MVRRVRVCARLDVVEQALRRGARVHAHVLGGGARPRGGRRPHLRGRDRRGQPRPAPVTAATATLPQLESRPSASFGLERGLHEYAGSFKPGGLCRSTTVEGGGRGAGPGKCLTWALANARPSTSLTTEVAVAASRGCEGGQGGGVGGGEAGREGEAAGLGFGCSPAQGAPAREGGQWRRRRVVPFAMARARLPGDAHLWVSGHRRRWRHCRGGSPLPPPLPPPSSPRH